MSTISTISVGNLVLNKATPPRKPRVEHYLIPSYQRGYRWTELHVSALLNDIDSFMNSRKSTDESYCLQPIAIVKQLDKDGYTIWEIVDGQQRLITLFLILNYLGQSSYKLSFEKRSQSEEFLSNLNHNPYCHDTPDHHFISKAHEIISNWFEEKSHEDMGYKNRFAVVLVDAVKIIWYEMDIKGTQPKEIEAEKIDLFNRLNIGKIPLEDAELVRALLLCKSYEPTPHELLFRQSEFSNEWHEIEQFLQKPEVWGFLTSHKELANHIQLIFELLAENKNSKNYSTYKWFEDTINKANNPVQKARELWNKTKHIYSQFKYWMSDRTVYHYAGFLLSIQKIDIKTLYKESLQNKGVFKSNLYTKILDYLNSVNLDTINYVDNPEKVKNILLLFNVLSYQELIDTPNNRFPFNQYNDIRDTQKWSLEHIHAQRSQDPLKREDIIRKWIEDTLASISKVDSISKEVENQTVVIDMAPYKKELSKFLEQNVIDIEKFNNIREKIIEVFDSGSIHNLDNMALLSCSNNSSLNNAIFPVKRNRIIQLEKEGHFVPLCTKNVFLKLYSSADNQPYYWSTSDKEAYVEAIKQVIEKFKNKKLK